MLYQLYIKIYTWNITFWSNINNCCVRIGIDNRNVFAVAIRLGKLRERLERKGIGNAWNEKEFRVKVENFGLGPWHFVRAVARPIIGGGGGGCMIHIFVFCPTDFF